MIHQNKDEFVKVLGRSSKKRGFLLPLIEKDYYLGINRDIGINRQTPIFLDN